MRELLACLVLVAACGDDGAPAGVDGGELDATYTRVTWTCMDGLICGGLHPDLTKATALTVAGRALTFANEAGVIDVQAADDETGGCLIVPGDPNEGLYARTAYQLCGDGFMVNATIGWRSASDPTQPFLPWSLHALR